MSDKFETWFMVKECKIQVFFELIQVALGNRDSLSRIPSDKEWNTLFEESVRQAVAGIAFEGLKKLPETQRPPQMLLFEWIALSEKIKQRNKYADKQTATIWQQLKDDGLETAILKGQGIADSYGELTTCRQSGDIDVWVKGGYQTVFNYVQRTHPTEDVAYHRFHYDFFKDMEVELHHRPTLMRNLIDDRKLTRWFNSFDADSFIFLKDKGFAVPPIEFNRIFILTHIYRHFLFEGIGLKQIIDYYYVLKSDVRCKKDEEKETLRALRLMRFAEALMWILHNALGLEEKYLICGMNEKEGRFVFSEIMQAGNFGQTDKRYSEMSKIRRMTRHGILLLLHYPSEVIWTPIWLIYHKIWRWNKIREIRINPCA